MNSLSGKNFGVVIAYLLPGVIVLWGASYQYDSVSKWLYGGAVESSTVGGFLFSTLFSILVGLICSTIRWLLIDTVHHRTGIHQPLWDYGKLQRNLEAYLLLEENHYRYYQFYANSLIAWVFGYGFWRNAEWRGIVCFADLGFVALLTVFYFGSRDTLQKYYHRVQFLLKSK